MAERNRVLPVSSIVAVPARGAWMGNRGCLHQGHEIVRPWRLRAALLPAVLPRPTRCAMGARALHTAVFLDEAVAFAAGHRPCGECRRHDYLAYRDAAGAATAGELDARLHAERQARGCNGQATPPGARPRRPWSVVVRGKTDGLTSLPGSGYLPSRTQHEAPAPHN